MNNSKRRQKINANKNEITNADISNIQGVIDSLQNAEYSLSQRMKLFDNRTHGGLRELYKTFGYDDSPTYETFYNEYKRNPIAKRVVDAFPNACWGEMPIITDDEETETESEFEKAVGVLFRKKSIVQYLRRFDILQRIGGYGVMIIGGGSDYSSMLTSEKINSLEFIMPYGEGNAHIDSYVTDPMNPRYGMPEKYTIKIGDDERKQSISIHYSHLIHTSENALDNNTLGFSCLLPVLNVLFDISKVLGGSAETYYLNARGGVHIDAEKKLDAKDADSLKDVLESYLHKLQRAIITQNVKVTPLNFNVHSPKEFFDVYVQAVSCATGVPQAILVGNEVGVRASGQDVGNWFSRVLERQINYCEPFMLRPFIDRLIELKLLPSPINDEYEIKWQDLSTPNELEKAQTANQIMDAANKYTNGMPSDIMTAEQACDIMGIEYRGEDLGQMADDESEDISIVDETIARDNENMNDGKNI